MSENIENMDDNKVEEVEVVAEEVTSNKKTATTPSNQNVSSSMTEHQLSSLNYSSFETPAKMLALGEVLCKSKLVPLKTPQDVMTALMTGKELGLPFITSVSQIYPINGRPTLGIHIQKALCLKNGIIFEKVQDAETIYQFVKDDGSGKPLMVNNAPVDLGQGTINEQPENSLKKAVTTQTKYKVTRYIKVPTGEYKEVVAYGSFSLLEASEAGLLEKEVWAKYWRRMLDARSLANAIREIASDITLGLYTPNELDGNVTISDEGVETIDVDYTSN